MNDYSLTKVAIHNYGEINGLIKTLIILVSVDILIELIRFGESLYLSKKDKNNKRQLLIEEKRIQVFETKIELLDAADNVLKYCTSTAFFETKSLDACHDFMDKIYKKAIRTSIYKCFEQLNE